MSIEIKYAGTQQRWPELSITGKQSVWMPGQIEERDDVEAGKLLATGLFKTEPTPLTATLSAQVVEIPYGPVIRRSIPVAEGIAVSPQRAKRRVMVRDMLTWCRPVRKSIPTLGFTAGWLI